MERDASGYVAPPLFPHAHAPSRVFEVSTANVLETMHSASKEPTQVRYLSHGIRRCTTFLSAARSWCAEAQQPRPTGVDARWIQVDFGSAAHVGEDGVFGACVAL